MNALNYESLNLKIETTLHFFFLRLSLAFCKPTQSLWQLIKMALWDAKSIKGLSKSQLLSCSPVSSCYAAAPVLRTAHRTVLCPQSQHFRIRSINC